MYCHQVIEQFEIYDESSLYEGWFRASNYCIN